MSKYEHAYIKHDRPDLPKSPHLEFGAMAHEVLEKAGNLRDMSEIGILTPDDYEPVIPSEVIGSDLKEFFKIRSWHSYFMTVILQIAEYEKELRESFKAEFGEDPMIERELHLQMTPAELASMGYVGITQPLVGVVDLLLHNDKGAYILDYKFSAKRKTQNDMDLNSQLPLYAMLVSHEYNVPLRNIKVGYIDIPKVDFEEPAVLANGKLSRATAQNVSQEMYEKAVLQIHGDDPEYNCKPGGYYYDAWCNYALNKAAYMTLQWLDLEAAQNIFKDLCDTASFIDRMKQNNLTYLKKYDSYSCGACDYKTVCKPWTTVGGADE